ncbi:MULTISPECIES: FHA domain-containing protein [unclassified Coleofasciculus]|uniref:FHA domain-containing protein n=1 Tax=unclassified Coleofasciculus TaxID=2692782 RepID=UPI001881D82F|nr:MULTISPECIES: FHA domain-containing protein [unclassified Coleofasciculus]MBE9125602.1 FHA domain-containing protein [Coleofasciculus sp. LEGE 07081]MBE9147316.1 FHA domain-containing protein [Coleofasciculus sp. LEGE 07092]
MNKIAELEIHHPDGRCETHELDLPLYTLGRGQHNSFRLIGDTAISLVHLSLKRIRTEYRDFYRIIDGKLDMRFLSQNGVYLNRCRIQYSADLRHNDEIRIGSNSWMIYRDDFERESREDDTMDLEDS